MHSLLSPSSPSVVVIIETYIFKKSKERHQIYSSTLYLNPCGIALSEELRALWIEGRGRRAPWMNAPQTFVSSFHYPQAASSKSITKNCSLPWFHQKIKWLQQKKSPEKHGIDPFMTASQPLFVYKQIFYWNALEEWSAWKILSGFQGLFRVSLFFANGY